MGKCIHHICEKRLVYGGTMSLLFDGRKNYLMGFCCHSIYSLLIEKEQNTKILKAMSQFQNLNLKACLLSFLAKG